MIFSFGKKYKTSSNSHCSLFTRQEGNSVCILKENVFFWNDLRWLEKLLLYYLRKNHNYTCHFMNIPIIENPGVFFCLLFGWQYFFFKQCNLSFIVIGQKGKKGGHLFK